MDPELQKSLTELKALTKENNEMLRKVKRSMKMGQIMSLIYWVFIIGSAIGAFYLIQPYWDQAKFIYEGYSEILNSSLGQ